MCMPTRGAALAEIHHAAVVVGGIAGLDDGLTRPGDRPGPPFDLGGAFHWEIGDVFERDHLHDDFLLMLTGVRPRSIEKRQNTVRCGAPVILLAYDLLRGISSKPVIRLPSAVPWFGAISGSAKTARRVA